MIKHELLQEKGILIVTPEGALKPEDFAEIAKEVDPYIEQKGKLHGLMIYTESFPGWESFAGMVSHFKFIRDHHKNIEKIAAVTDSSIMSIMPKIGNHFLKAEVKHFDYKDKEAAMAWLKSCACIK